MEERRSEVQFKRSEAGYNLVFLMVTLTLLSIMLAAALPKWSHAIRREREEELISRGWQYAEAVRIFQNRFQRLPVRLEELIEVEPRSIRKLWKDPMTDEGKWALIPPGQGGPVLTPQPETPDGRNPGEDEDSGGDSGEDGEPSEEVDPGTGIGKKKGIVQVGPFIGVHSRSSKESILILFGRDRYDQWHFTADLLREQGGQQIGGDPTGGAVGGGGGGLIKSTRWLGRPLPAFLQLPQGNQPQDGQMPDGSTPRNPRNPRNPGNAGPRRGGPESR